MSNTSLLIIDPQNDFCDISPSGVNQPALPVTGADADMGRLSQFITRGGSRIDSVYVTLDTHSPYDIGHPSYWTNANGERPGVFTSITLADILRKTWVPVDSRQQEWVIFYARAVTDKGLGGIDIWPEHCIGGTWGHGIHASVRDSINNWSRTNAKPLNLVFKGSNPNTESYSAIEAVVPILTAPDTQYNSGLVARISGSELILVAGEALSHCVASTVWSLFKSGQVSPTQVVLLTDCMSPVSGFEAQAQSFLDDMSDLGVKSASSSDFNF